MLKLLYKGKSNKSEILKYGPVLILNIFDIVYKGVMKSQLICYFDIVFSPCLAAYRRD